MEDLISIGTIGLIKAVNSYDSGKNIKLATYASRCIENEILMYLRRNNKTRMSGYMAVYPMQPYKHLGFPKMLHIHRDF